MSTGEHKPVRVTVSSLLCDKMLGRSSFRKEGFILTHSWKVKFVVQEKV